MLAHKHINGLGCIGMNLRVYIASGNDLTHLQHITRRKLNFEKKKKKKQQQTNNATAEYHTHGTIHDLTKSPTDASKETES